MELVRQTLASNGLKLSSKKRVIFGGKAAKIITGVRLGAGRVRAPKDKVRDLRAAIHRLEIGCIEKQKRAKYLESLQGRLHHIERICAADVALLKRQLERVLAKGPRRQRDSIKIVDKSVDPQIS
jgi:hypothetical protein